MAKFRVQLCGRHLQLELDGERQELGFHTTRFVEATSADQARARALESIEQHPAVATQLREHTPGFAVLVEAVELLPADHHAPPKQPGLAFYPEEGGPPLA
jgi:hypothetical protein